jgi:hypothetical protein
MGEKFHRGIWNIWGRSHLVFFGDVVKEQYYPIDKYEYYFMRWNTLQKEKRQTTPEFTNTFHTFHTKLGIKDSKRHLVMKYHGDLHRYIQIEMDFLNISSLGVSYRYAVKIKHKFGHQHKWEFRSTNMKQPNHGKDGPNQQPHKNQSKEHEKKGKVKMKNNTYRKWCGFHKYPWNNIDECHSK